MKSKTLLDAQPSIQDFLNEAEYCAQNGRGFAAMCTMFPVMLAVSEAVHPDLTRAGELIQEFVSEMADKSSWLIRPSSISIVPTDSDISRKIADLRNALAHELSLPTDLMLVDTVAHVRRSASAPRDKWYIGTSEFVGAVRDTSMQLIARHGHMLFDPNPPQPRSSTQRGPAVGSTPPWGPSASGTDKS